MSTLKQTLPNPHLPWAVPYDPVVKLIALAEGCSLVAYKCPSGVWTIGYGETEGGVHEGETMTQAEADVTFCRSLARYAARVQAMCMVPTNINQLGALVSLAYNIGLGAPGKAGGLLNSSVLKAHNRGDNVAAARAFNLYTNGRDPKTKKLKEFPGLVRRRATEAALYLSPVEAPVLAAAEVAAPPALEPTPQAVATPTPVASHPLTLAGAATMATSALTALNDATTQAQALGTSAQAAASNAQATVSSVQTAASTAHGIVHTLASLAGISPALLLAGVLFAVGGFAIYHVARQRKQGHA